MVGGREWAARFPRRQRCVCLSRPHHGLGTEGGVLQHQRLCQRRSASGVRHGVAELPGDGCGRADAGYEPHAYVPDPHFAGGRARCLVARTIEFLMPRRPPVSRIAHIQAPTGGWNAFDSVAEMPPTDAIQLDNFFPETTWCRLRRGSTLYATLPVTTNPVRSLMTYSTAAGDKLLAASGGSIYDATPGGAGATWDNFNWDHADWDNLASIPTVASGFTSDVWQWVNFSTPGGQFIVAVNGTPITGVTTGNQWIYNGSTWTAQSGNTWGPSGTPPPISNTWCCIAAFQQRLFFTGTDNLYLYYLPVNVLQDEVHGIDLGSFLPLGGQIACMGTWTRDDGAGGMDDLLVIATTNGEVLSYSGINPDDSNAWQMIGRFQIGRPVSGHRQLCRLGPDMMLICEDGCQALAHYLALGTSQALTTSLSRKIGNAVSAAVRLNKGAFGWDAILYPKNNALYVNVPQQDGSFQQYVVNTITGAWCRYLGLQAYCCARIGDNLYFGGANGTIVQADTGASDQGQPIVYNVVTAFQTGDSAMQKRATMCRPYIVTDWGGAPLLDVNVDYSIEGVSSPLTDINAFSTAWDGFNWDAAPWDTGPLPVNNWYSVQGIGNAFAIHMQGASMANVLNLLAFDLALESGMGFV